MYSEKMRTDIFCGHPRGDYYPYDYEFCTVRNEIVESKQEPCENYVGVGMEEIRSKVLYSV
jgi:hypothetical protein